MKKRQYDASIVVLWLMMNRLVTVLLLAQGCARALTPRVRQSVVQAMKHVVRKRDEEYVSATRQKRVIGVKGHRQHLPVCFKGRLGSFVVVLVRVVHCCILVCTIPSLIKNDFVFHLKMVS